MSSMAMRNKNTTLPVSKWDVRIQANKRRRYAEIRRNILLLIAAVFFICIIVFGINSMISEAGDAEGKDISFKYYKNICIGQGESLTSVAKTYADEEHYESHDSYIREVVYMNHLKDADDICEGTYLIVPYYSNILR